jgi:hypothetical protein
MPLIVPYEREREGPMISGFGRSLGHAFFYEY